MAATQAEILDLLRSVFTETLPHRTLPADDAPLFADGGALDSLDLVSFVGEVEEEVNERWDADIVVAHARAMSRSKSPFRSLAVLAEYCVELLSEDAA